MIERSTMLRSRSDDAAITGDADTQVSTVIATVNAANRRMGTSQWRVSPATVLCARGGREWRYFLLLVVKGVISSDAWWPPSR